MRFLILCLLLALMISVARSQDLFQAITYTYCNASSFLSASCSLGVTMKNAYGSYQYSGAVPLFGNFPGYYDMFSTSHAFVDYCEEGMNNYIGYVINFRYKCPPTVYGSKVYIMAYLFNGSSLDAGYHEYIPVCDNTFRSGYVSVNVSAVKNHYDLNFPFSVYHEINLTSSGGSGDVYIEGVGELTCIKNVTLTGLLNGNGGVNYVVDKPYIVGFKSVPIIYSNNEYKVGFTNVGCPHGNCLYSSTSYTVDKSVKVLDFYVPHAEKLFVTFKYSTESLITFNVSLTNGVDYFNSYAFSDNTGGSYRNFYMEFDLNDTAHRKFSFSIVASNIGFGIDEIGVGIINLIPPVTTTTTTTTIPRTTTTLPSNVHAQVSQISVSDSNPTIDQDVRIRVKVTNIGFETWNFPVGVSIGKNGIYCNRDCYVDGKGDYVYTGNIHPGQTVEVERIFKFRDEYFDYGESYDLLVGVYAYPYMIPSQAYDYEVLSNYFNIVPLEQKLDAFPISVKASKPKVAKNDYVDITSYILNNGSISYNFTIGMSIGMWDAETGVFKNYKPSLLPPCNTECYVDDKGDWVHVMIPPNYTDPVKRSFKIPEYFLDDNPFDVAIGIYTDRPENGGKLISISYFKNVSKTTTEPSVTQQLAGQAKSAIDAFMIMSSTAFGVPISGAKILFVVFIESLVVYLVFRYNQTGVDNRIVILSLVMLMTFAFTAIGWFPLILAILVILVCGLILYSIIRG